MYRIYIPRILESRIHEAVTQFPVIVLTGPRQTGKSTLLKHSFPDYEYVTLDDPVLRRTSIEDPALFLENFPTPCIIDEIQYTPELLQYIKIEVDKDRSKTGLYILTGSQIFPLMKGLTESLAGRTAIFELMNIGLDESPLEQKNLPSLFDRIYTGSYPDPLIHKINRNIFYSSYIQTYLERDIRLVENVKDILLFQGLLEMLAARTGTLLNKSDLANSLGVSQPTISKWIALLENSRIIYLLRPFSKNIKKRIVKAPKIYFTDTGLLSFLLKYPDSKTLSAGPLNGSVLENFLITEVLKNKTNSGSLYEPYFYRDSNKNEIDLVLDYGYKQALCEIKLNKTIQSKHYNQMQNLSRQFTSPELFLLSAYPEILKVSDSVTNYPVWDINKIV